MRVLSNQEIHAVSGSASTTSTGSVNAFSSFTNLLLGLFALFTGGNFIKYLY
jgi:hypothetical protein